MSAYENFIVDLPERLAQLNQEFSKIAKENELEVSYALMLLGAAFILPYERVDGTSGLRLTVVEQHKAIRKDLELDKRFPESSYNQEHEQWFQIDVNNFSRGPRFWERERRNSLRLPVHEVLTVIRNAVAHSNLHFGGERKIEHVYFGNRKENNPETDNYTVIGCDVKELSVLLDAWVNNLGRIKAGSAQIWKELDKAA